MRFSPNRRLDSGLAVVFLLTATAACRAVDLPRPAAAPPPPAWLDADLLGDPFAPPAHDGVAFRSRRGAPKVMRAPTRDALAALLDSGAPDDRAEAAWALGEAAVNTPAVVRGLAALVGDPAAASRSAAAFALGRLAWSAPPSSVAADALATLMADAESMVRAEAIDASALWAETLAAARQIPGLTAWGRSGRDALDANGPPEPALAPLVREAPADADLRAELDARGASLIRAAAAWPADDPAPSVRRAVVRAAGAFVRAAAAQPRWTPPPDALGPAVDAANRILFSLADPDAEKIPSVVARALEGMADNPSAPADDLRGRIRAVLRIPDADRDDDPWAVARLAALRAAHRLADMDGDLRPYAACSATPLRRAAVEALIASIGGRAPEIPAEWLVAALRDSDETVRAAAASGYARAAPLPEAALAALVPLWRDPSARTRRAASAALAGMIPGRARAGMTMAETVPLPADLDMAERYMAIENAALAAARSPRGDERREGLWLLGAMGSTAGFPELLAPAQAVARDPKLSEDPARVAEASLVLWRVGRTGYKEGVAVAQDMLASPASPLRVHAARALGLLADAKSVGILRGMLLKTVAKEDFKEWACAGDERTLGLWALGRIDDPEARKAILDIVSMPPTPTTSVKDAVLMARALVRSGDRSAAKGLARAVAVQQQASGTEANALAVLADAIVLLGGIRPAGAPAFQPRQPAESEFFLNVTEPKGTP